MELNINAAIDLIESDSVSGDILYGNSPRDMAVRSMRNKEIISVIDYLTTQPLNIEFVLTGLDSRLNKAPENQLYLVGTLIAYFEVLRNFPSQKVNRIFQKTISDLNPDSLLRQAITFLFEKIPKKEAIQMISVLATRPAQSYTVKTSAMDVKIDIN